MGKSHKHKKLFPSNGCGTPCHDCGRCHHTCDCGKDQKPRRKRMDSELNEMRNVDKQERRNMYK